MFKVLKTALRTIGAVVITTASRIIRGQAQGAVEKFVQQELRRAAQYYLEVVTP